MDNIELLSKQIQEYQEQNREQLKIYQEQNQREHEQLSGQIRQLLTEVHVLYSERNMNEEKFDRLFKGQSDIKETVQKIDDRVENLEDRQMKRDHLVKWIVAGITVAATVAGIIYKFF